MDFVGPITPLLEPNVLVGMEHGTPISGIGIIQWRFHILDINITKHANYYHVSNDRALLLIPQQIIRTRRNSTGTFTISDKCAIICLEGKPSLQITYDSKSYFPVALSRNDTATSSPNEVNI